MLQSLFDFFRYMRAPLWLKEVLKNINDLLFSILHQIGLQIKHELEKKIVEVSNLDISSREKFEKVFDYAIKRLKLEHLSTSALNLLIEILVNHLKKKGVIYNEV